MNQPGSPQYAGFWRRVAATLIDGVIYSLLFGLLLGPMVMNAGLFSKEGAVRTLIGVLVTIVLWMKFLGTPGKLLLACQVVDADSHTPLTLHKSLVRYMAYLASILPLMLGFLWIAKDARKQGFHDKIANSVVLYRAGIETDDESSKTLQQLVSEIR